ARNAHRYVKLRRNDFSGLAHLPVVGRIPRVHRSARRPQGCAQLVCQGLEQLEVLGAAQATPARYNHRGASQLGAIALGYFASDKRRQARISNSVDILDAGLAAFRSNRIKRRGAYCYDFNGVGGLHSCNGVACVNGPLEGVGRFHSTDVGNLSNVELRGDAWCNVFTVGRGGEKNMAVAVGHRQHLGRHVFTQGVCQRIAVSDDNLGDAGRLGGLFGHGLSVGTGYQNVNLTTNLLGGSHDVEGGGLHLCIVVFSYDKYWHDQITFASFFSFSTRVAT